MKKIKRFLDYFRPPREEFVEKNLRKMGILKNDANYEEYKAKFTKLIKRKSNENNVSSFCTSYSKLMGKKVKKKLKEKDEKISDLEKKLKGITNVVNMSTPKIVEYVLAPDIFTIKDPHTYKIMKILREHEKRGLKTLKRDIDLENHDLKWRLKFLSDLGIIEVIKLIIRRFTLFQK